MEGSEGIIVEKRSACKSLRKIAKEHQSKITSKIAIDKY